MRQIAVVALIMSLPFAAAVADVYRSVDAQGQVHYSDTPTPGAELVHVQKLGMSSFNAPPSTPAGNAKAPPDSSAPPPDPVAASKLPSRPCSRMSAQTRAYQLKKARGDYNRGVGAGGIYQAGADGERQYLTDAEAEQQRVNLHQAMDAACNEQ